MSRTLPFAAILGLALAAAPARAQLTPDQAADMLLNSARKGFNEKNYPFAVSKFREFLGKYGGHKNAPAARFGLGLALVEGFDKNYNEARDLLQGVANLKDFPDRPLALYYLGLAQRGLALNEWQLAQGKPPQEVQQRTAAARQRFGEAATSFSQALAGFDAQLQGKEPPKNDKGLLADAEWAARARCDLAEALIRQDKLKEARDAAAPFLKDVVLARSRYRQQGIYYHGYASLLLHDLPAAEKSLSLLAPFDQPVFGNHARYLLARVHHLADERTEAAAHYEAVIADYQKARAHAAKLSPQEAKQVQADPVLRAEIEALLRGPVPDHVGRAQFYLGVLMYEGGKFADARARLQDFLKQYPQTPLRTEAELRIGFCQVQMKDFADAVRTLTPLVDRDPRLSDQVLLWLGKAQAGAAPDAHANPKGHDQAIQTAVNTLRQAADRAQKRQDQDPEARTRRAEIQVEIGDQLQRIKHHKEAAAQYSQVLTDKALPLREEEVLQRLAVALHLAGDYAESDKVCRRYCEKFPQGPLTPAVLFTEAENSYFRLLAAEKAANPAERQKLTAPLYEETTKRLAAVAEKFPEFPKVNLARFTLGLVHYRRGELDKARQALEQIPAPERTGEVALTSYLIADSILRHVPAAVPEDALAAGKMEEQLKSSADLLEAFISLNPQDNQVPEALIKLGLCQQRLAGLASQPAERTKLLQAARATYERLFVKEFAGIPQVAQGTFERAKCIGLAGDLNGAVNELRRFTTDPLRQYTQVAPMALVQMATFLRAQNRPAEAADLLAKGIPQHEANLNKDPERSFWVGLMRYHQGVALREAGKLPEARALFEGVLKSSAGRPEANDAALRLGQCMLDEGRARIEAAHKLGGSARKEDQAKGQQLAAEAIKSLHTAVDFLQTQAKKLADAQTQPDVCARMLYDAAWGARLLTEPEIAAARAELAKKSPPVQAVPLRELPLVPSEKRARALYQSVIDDFAELPIATEARFELAELLADRGENDKAAALLNDVLDKEPSPELTEKVRLRLGGIQAAKGNLKAALAQFDAVAQNPKSPLAGWAHYRAAEALLADKQADAAIKRLVIFRDQGPYQNVPGLSDRAMLRLGYAYALNKAWDPSRQAYERVLAIAPNGPWADEARYGIAWAFQQQKNYDGAVNAYTQITSRVATELAARAQLQIGLCRMEQKRFADAATALMAVPYNYDYPELKAAARFEAARAYSELNQRDLARRQLELLQKEFPGTPWSDAAKERLGALKVK